MNTSRYLFHIPSAILLPLFSAFWSIVASQNPGTIRELPPTRWSRPHNTDVKHIALDLRFDWAKKQAYGIANITLALLQPSDKIVLDAGRLVIHSITTPDGKPLTFNYDGSDRDGNLEIWLNQKQTVDGDLTLTIDYHSTWPNLSDPNSLGGSYGKGLRFFEPTSTDPLRRKQLWSTGEPQSNRYWFPGYDAPNDFHTSELRATVASNLTVISNGKLLSNKANADGTRTFHWKMEAPHPNHQTSVVVGEFVDVSQAFEGLNLHSFGYPDESEATAASVVRLPDMMRFFSEKTGVKYPFPSYSQVFVQDLPNVASNASTATITENMVDDYPTHAEFFYLWDLTEGEALAQQWFGNLVSCSDWSDIWLNKAFGRYLSGLYTDHKNGHDEYLLYQLTFDQTTYLNDWNANLRRPIVTRNYDDLNTFVGDNYPYFRGAAVLHTLHKHLGDELWWKSLQTFLQNNAHRPASTDDLRQAVEAVSGEPMDWFFDQWLYRVGHPVFEILQNYDPNKRQLVLTVKQVQKKDPLETYPQVEFFQGKIEIRIDDRVETVWLEPKAENIFAFTAAESPQLVHFDPEDAWLKEIRFHKSLDKLLHQFQEDPDILGQRWAMLQLVALVKDQATSEADKSQIYNAFRRVMSDNNNYWRLRFNATTQLQSLLAPVWMTTPATLDTATIETLVSIIKTEKMWNRSSAINFLGMTHNPQFEAIYLDALRSENDRVVNAAANALGKCKSTRALDALQKLTERPSWKGQSIISALNGLKWLDDPRGYAIAYRAFTNLHSPHWTLATPVWDCRLAAAETLATLGKTEAACDFVSSAFQKAVSEDDLHGMFYNALLAATLAAPCAQGIFEVLKNKSKDNTNAMTAAEATEALWKNALKK